MNWQREVLKLRVNNLPPCESALEWIASLPADISAQEAWDKCEHADWLSWVVHAIDGWTGKLSKANWESRHPARWKGQKDAVAIFRTYYPHPPVKELAESCTT